MAVSADGSRVFVAVFESGNGSTILCGGLEGGVLSLTKSLSIEFIKRGVRVNAIIPGAIATNMHSQFRLPEGGDFELLKGAIPHIPYGTPECVAGTIAFLCSKDAAFIHGAELLVDGGAMS